MTDVASRRGAPRPDDGTRSARLDALRWTVAQMGSRERYAVARAFHGVGRLERLYTDTWCRTSPERIKAIPGGPGRFGNRWHADLPPQRVVSFTPTSIARDLPYWTLKGQRSAQQLQRRWLRNGEAFGRRVGADIVRRPLEPGRDALFAYSGGALELVRQGRDRGVLTVVDQIDPGRSDFREIATEQRRWPGWEGPIGPMSEAYFSRIREEWSTASAVVVNSEWSRRAAIDEGCPPDRIMIVPLAYEEGPPQGPRPRAAGNRRLKVLSLGQVILRKGIPYLIEAARFLPDADFVVAGRIGVTRQALSRLPDNVRVLGQVSRSIALDLFEDADVFVLPTLSDGFALTQLEAMAHGLPVISTDRCGDVVVDGANGFRVPVRDPAAIVRALSVLDGDRELLADMSDRARLSVGAYTFEAYLATLQRELGRVLQTSRGT